MTVDNGSAHVNTAHIATQHRDNNTVTNRRKRIGPAETYAADRQHQYETTNASLWADWIELADVLAEHDKM